MAAAAVTSTASAPAASIAASSSGGGGGSGASSLTNSTKAVLSTFTGLSVGLSTLERTIASREEARERLEATGAVSRLPTHLLLPSGWPVLPVAVDAAPLWHTEPGVSESTSRYGAMRIISTYPMLDSAHAVREGDPVADVVCVQVFADRTVAAIADGCNWGVRPQTAARRASQRFVEYMRTRSPRDVQETGHFMLRALSEANSAISEGVQDIWDAGTTTLLGAVLTRLDRGDNNADSRLAQWGFMCCSVGDCKAFHFSRVTETVTDVTEGNRTTDTRDPGGRLGPYVGKGNPDLRNLYLFFRLCHAGDLVLLMSDGIHDNLDPELLGKTPRDIGLAADSWLDADPNEAFVAKNRFRTAAVKDAILESALRPDDIASRLVKHARDTTHNVRSFMEENPRRRQPTDYKEYPGKMDHSSCLVLVVGESSDGMTPRAVEGGQ